MVFNIAIHCHHCLKLGAAFGAMAALVGFFLSVWLNRKSVTDEADIAMAMAIVARRRDLRNQGINPDEWMKCDADKGTAVIR